MIAVLEENNSIGQEIKKKNSYYPAILLSAIDPTEINTDAGMRSLETVLFIITNTFK